MRDEVRTTPRQLFTPKNSWGFKGSRSFQEIPHAFHVQFIAPELGYQTGVTTVYRPGYDVQNATIFEDLPTFGITEWHAAAQYGVYMMAQALVRSETFTLSCEAESLVTQRGDLVHIQHDVPLLGGTSCIVKSVAGNRITVDENLNYTLGPFGYTWRKSDGTVSTGDVFTVGADWFEVAGTPAIQPGDLVVVGVKKASNLVTDPYIVMSVNPKADFTAELTLVRYDERVYDPNFANFPTWNPSFGESPAEGAGFGIVNLTGFAGLDHVDRQPVCLSILDWSISPVNFRDNVAATRIEFRKNGQSAVEELIQVQGNVTSWTHEYSPTDTRFGAGTYTLTAISNLGYESQPKSIKVGQIVDRTPPARPTGFTATLQTDGTTLLTWNKGTEKDLWSYVIKDGTRIVKVLDWDKGSYVIDTTDETTYTLTAVDSSGNSSSAASASTTHPAVATPTGFQIHVDGRVATFKWDLLPDKYVTAYKLFYNPNLNATSHTAIGSVPIGTVDKSTDTFTTDAKEGSYFLVAQNMFGNTSNPAKQSTTFDTLAVTGLRLTQALEYADRYPYSRVKLTWGLIGDPDDLRHFRVSFHPADSVSDETIYQGDLRNAEVLWDAVRERYRHNGWFTVQPISIYGTIGQSQTVEFHMLKDTTPPDAPEKFFVNIRNNTVADCNWLPSRSVDIEGYEIRFTTSYANPSWAQSERMATFDHQHH